MNEYPRQNEYLSKYAYQRSLIRRGKRGAALVEALRAGSEQVADALAAKETEILTIVETNRIIHESCTLYPDEQRIEEGVEVSLSVAIEAVLKFARQDFNRMGILVDAPPCLGLITSAQHVMKLADPLLRGAEDELRVFQVIDGYYAPPSLQIIKDVAEDQSTAVYDIEYYRR